VSVRIAIPDMISPSYFPAIAAVELGFFEREGLEATIELIFPVTKTYEELREGRVDYVGGAAHAPLYAFPDWQGCKLVCALSKHMYWFLVVRADLDAQRGDLTAVKGLRIAAAPGPVDGLRRMLAVAGVDPDRDVDIVPVPAAAGGGVSFGVSAAKALADGQVDGFWANGMGAEMATRTGAGQVLIDARRGDGPAEARAYTFPALVATDDRIAEDPGEVAAAVRAVVTAQRALREDPTLARTAAMTHFPDEERGLIADLVARDAPFYDASVSERETRALNDFAHAIGLLDDPSVRYEEVVASGFAQYWGS
jgi:NitT/TauT family transport system substrate-binding protein